MIKEIELIKYILCILNVVLLLNLPIASIVKPVLAALMSKYFDYIFLTFYVILS